MTELEESQNKLVMNWMKLPALYHGKTLATIKGLEKEINTAKEAIVNGNGLFITGSCGTGKTHLAVSLMIDFAMKNRHLAPSDLPKFLPSVELFLDLRQTFSSEQSEKSVLDRWSKPDLICIDDVGAEKISDWTRQSFYTLIDRRYRDMKQTIITSNLSLEKIATQIDDRISSRIVEMCVVIELNGDDYRIKKGVKNGRG